MKEAFGEVAGEQFIAVKVPSASKRVGIGFTLLYAFAYLGTWMVILTPAIVSLALRIQQIDPRGKGADLALVLGVGTVFGILAGPLCGNLSDRTTLRFGMRRPWLIGGVILGSVGALVIATTQQILVMLVGWCIMQIAFYGLLAALVAVLADQVPPEQRGRISGILGTAQSIAAVLGVFLVQTVARSAFWLFVAPGIVALVAILAFAFFLKDRKLDLSERPPAYSLQAFFRSFWVNPRRYPDFGWAWISRFFVFMSLGILLTYQPFYLIDHLKQHPLAVPIIVSTATLIQAVFVVLSSNVSGWLADRLQRSKIFVQLAAVICIIAYIIISFTSSVSTFFVVYVFAGIAIGTYLTVDLVLVTGVLPNRDKDAAKDLAVLSIANTLPLSLSPALAPLFLAIGGGNNYSALFIVSIVFAILGATAIQPVKGAR